MKNLVIGNTSQLSMYFPSSDDYVAISSRNIDIEKLTSERWNTVHVCFAEQRTYLASSTDSSIRDLFWETNCGKTLSLIDDLKKHAQKIIYYSTAELWNKAFGPIDASMPYCFYENHYTSSKAHTSSVLKDKDKYPNVMVVYPFNFNSVHRKGQYLFGKVFDSISNKKIIEIGDTHFYREMLHPKMVVDATLKFVSQGNLGDTMVGSGRLIYIDDFIKRLYEKFGLNSENYIRRVISEPSKYRQHIFYSSEYNSEYGEDKLLNFLVNELKGLNHEQCGTSNRRCNQEEDK